MFIHVPLPWNPRSSFVSPRLLASGSRLHEGRRAPTALDRRRKTLWKPLKGGAFAQKEFAQKVK